MIIGRLGRRSKLSMSRKQMAVDYRKELIPPAKGPVVVVVVGGSWVPDEE